MSRLNGLGTPYELAAMSKEFTEGVVRDMAAAEDKALFEKDWKEVHSHTCDLCKGKGKRLDLGRSDPCMNCEGSGIEYEIHYGVRNQQTFMYSIEYGIEAKKETCKAFREAYEETRKAGKVSNISYRALYALPYTIKMELKAKGFPVDEQKNEDQIKDIARYVAKHYPDFLLQPHTNF